MSANNLKLICDWVENSPQRSCQALGIGLQRLKEALGKKGRKINHYYRARGFWAAVGMVNAMILMWLFIAFLVSMVAGILFAIMIAPWSIALASRLARRYFCALGDRRFGLAV